ncbi:MAG: dipeptide transport system permease protein DppB [Thermodesulfobacteriota bacterium]|nr:MAG: dipeptide transport system permease protein DppB [Thermodesulfobacteriota bacterium]
MIFKFILSRAFTGLFVVLVVVTITFFLLRMLPGGPFDEEKELPDQIRKNIEAKYNLDQPSWKQYLLYIEGLSKGDFGPSYKYVDRSVNDIIRETLPVSIELGLVGLFLSIALGSIVGIVSAIKPRGVFDFFAVSTATALVSVPSFVIGAVLIYIFSVRFRIFPAALWGSPSHIVLPALTLAAGPAAYLARLIRASMLETSEALYVRTARAKGLSNFMVITKHILRNALIPVVTVMGPITAFLITGSFVVEHIFAIPGIGRFFVLAVSNRDYPLVMGITIVYTIILVLANLVVDILYVYLDPRIKFDKGGVQ